MKKIVFFFFLTTSLFAQKSGIHYTWPVPASDQITGVFGEYRNTGTPDHFHGGVDIFGGLGTTIVSAASATVVAINVNKSYGPYVELEDGNGNFILDAHCLSTNANYQGSPPPASTEFVTVGQMVNAGDPVATIGNSNLEGTCLHFEVRTAINLTNTTRLNPFNYFIVTQGGAGSDLTDSTPPVFESAPTQDYNVLDSYVFLPGNKSSWVGVFSQPITNDIENGVSMVLPPNGTMGTTYVVAGTIEGLIHAYDEDNLTLPTKTGLYSYQQNLIMPPDTNGNTLVAEFGVAFDYMTASDYQTADALYGTYDPYVSNLRSRSSGLTLSNYYYQTFDAPQSNNSQAGMVFSTINNYLKSSQGAVLNVLDQYGNFVSNNSAVVGGAARINGESNLKDGNYMP